MLIPPLQRRCRECVTCVNDAFANGNGLGEALGPLSRCSKSGRDHPRRLLTAAASANSSIPAVDLNPDFDTAAFEDPYALITISPAYGLAPAAFTGPARGPDAITCAGPPADFTVAASVGPATTAPSYPPPIAFTSAPLNPLGADGYVTGPIVTCATYSPDGYAPGHTPSSGSASTGSGGSAQGGGGSHSNGGSAGGAPSKPNTVNPQDLILPNDISRAVTDPHLLIPSGRPVTGLGCLSDRTLSTWQCQHLSTRLSAKGDTLHVVCGQYCETERHLVEHYNRVHGPVNILLPGFWHPCDNCDAFGVRWKKCVSCGTEAEFADARWVCGSVGAGVTPPGHVIIGLAPPPPEDNPAAVDKIFKGLAPEVLATFGFPSVYCATLRPMYGSGYIFSRQFYSCLEDGKVEEVEDDDDE